VALGMVSPTVWQFQNIINGQFIGGTGVPRLRQLRVNQFFSFCLKCFLIFRRLSGIKKEHNRNKIFKLFRYLEILVRFRKIFQQKSNFAFLTGHQLKKTLSHLDHMLVITLPLMLLRTLIILSTKN